MTGRDRRAERTGSRRLPRGAPPIGEPAAAGYRRWILRHSERQEACSPAGRAAGQRAACPGPSPVRPAAGKGGGRPGLGGLWLLLVPVACCGGPLLVTVLAATGILAWGGLGIAFAAVLAGVLLATRLRRRSRARDGAGEEPRRRVRRPEDSS